METGAINKILMATDLSPRCERALQRAIVLADQFGAELRVLHVVQEAFVDSVTLQHETIAQSFIEEQIARLGTSNKVNAKLQIVRGTEHECIIDEAQSFGADLIVLGTHRHTAPELFQGTTIERVVRYGRTPVLMIKNAVDGPYGEALVGIDLSDQAMMALEFAAKLTAGGLVQMLHVTHRPFSGFLSRETQDQAIQEQKDEIATTVETWVDVVSGTLGEGPPKFENIFREGAAAAVIKETADELKPELIAIGTHGRTGIAHAVIGSVAEEMLASAPCDVLVVGT